MDEDKDAGRYWWVTLLVVFALVVGGFWWLGQGDRDWTGEADDARTCEEATALVAEWFEEDDNGLRGEGTHGYLTERVAELCG